MRFGHFHSSLLFEVKFLFVGKIEKMTLLFGVSLKILWKHKKHSKFHEIYLKCPKVGPISPKSHYNKCILETLEFFKKLISFCVHSCPEWIHKKRISVEWVAYAYFEKT